MSERNIRQWRLLRGHRDPIIEAADPVGDAAIGGLTVGVVLVVIALALLVGWAVLRFVGVLH